MNDMYVGKIWQNIFLQFKTGMWKAGAGENGDPTSVYNGEFFLSLCDKFHLLWSKAIKYVTGKF